MIEIFEGPVVDGPATLIRAVELPLAEELRQLLCALGCEAIRPAAGQVPLLRTVTGPLPVDELLAGR